MPLTRRQFLKAPLALVATASLPVSLLAAVAAETPPLPDLSDWASVRSQFMLDPAYAHFASFFISSHPTPVRDALEGYRRAIDLNPFLVVERAMFEDDAHNLPLRVREAAAGYLGGNAAEVALTRSTTESLALVYHGLPLRRGDEVLTTTHDHYSHHQSIALATERVGASMRRIDLFEDPALASTDAIVGRLLAALRPRTRVVGLTWVHSSSGIRLPIREIATALKARRSDVLLVVDGVHGLGAVHETVATMGADYFAAGTHKWMFGPRGTGLIWAKEEAWARLRPTVPDFSDLESYLAWAEERAPRTPTNAARISPGGFHAFEHQWGAAAAFAMHQAMGPARVGARIAALNDRLKAGLAENPKVRVLTPRASALSAGLVTFDVDGVAPADVVARLLERGIVASTSPYAVSHPRLAPSLVNDEVEVDRAVAAVRAISG